MKQKTNLRGLFYRLGRQFGEEITVMIPKSRDTNYATGTITAENDEHIIQNAPVLPADMIRDFVYDLSFIAANKNFTYGGIFNQGERLVLIDINNRNIIIDDIVKITIGVITYTVKEWTAYSTDHFALLIKVVEGRH